MVKLTITGNIVWQKNFGGSADDVFPVIRQTTDGGYIVAGTAVSDDGDVTGHHGSIRGDYWIIKLNSNGALQWQKALGGTNLDNASSVQQTVDGGYIVAGYSLSSDGDVTGHHGTTATSDLWIVKLNSAGNIRWQKSLGGSANEVAYAIRQLDNGSYIVAGSSNSNDGDATGGFGPSDNWIVQLDSTGVIEWKGKFGGTDDEAPYAIQATNDGGYIAASYSRSNNGHVSGNKGEDDYWIAKINGSCMNTVTAYWLGSVDTNWSNPANWRCSHLPYENIDAVIPSGILRYPIIFSNASVKSLTVQPNAMIHVNTGVTLTIKGI